ncbi:MAG: glycosyltransferase family 2 protein [Clostridia bacterium]|nr:glycosyltransferase family 2 protein [Clostridia bacterium]
MKFSIIVPIYNIEEYLPKCLESITNQTHKDFEVLLVDDGSPDNSAQICKEYEAKDSRFKHLKKENGGLSDARNYGFKHAAGEYVFFLDGDDFITEDALEKLNTELEKHPYDILSFNNYVYSDGATEEVKSKQMDWDVGNEIKFMLSAPAAWRRVYKYDFWKNNNLEYKKGIIYEDLALTPGLVNYTTNIGHIDEYLYYYVVRTNSIMREVKFKPNRDDKFISLETLENTFKEHGNYDKYKNEIEYLHIKHLIIMYTMEILKYDKEIYAPRLEKALKVMKEKYPKYTKNIYLKKEPLKTRLYVQAFNLKCIFLLRKMAMIANGKMK